MPEQPLVIAAYARSAFTPARRGALAGQRPDDTAATVVRALVDHARIDPATIEDVTVGCAFPEAEQGMNMGRIVALLAGLPRTVAGQTVNRYCGSSMQGIHTAAGSLRLGAGDAYVCAGVESMTRVPMGGFNPLPNPRLAATYPAVYLAMGETAEIVAERYGIDRERQEAFAVTSQQRAATARAEGRFRSEIIPVSGIDEDGCLRPETTPDVLAALQLAFRAEGHGTVTAGTSSPLTDGAAAVLVTTASYAARNGLEPLAEIRAIAVAGCDADVMGIGPVAASRKAMQRAGISPEDLSVVELNEAFASQALACIDQLALDPEVVNIDGGAIALGHPLGATGARITGKAAALLRASGGRYALATQCIGGGQGIATVLASAA